MQEEQSNLILVTLAAKKRARTCYFGTRKRQSRDTMTNAQQALRIRHNQTNMQETNPSSRMKEDNGRTQWCCFISTRGATNEMTAKPEPAS